MTPTFDVLYEAALHTDEFGEGNTSHRSFAHHAQR